MYLKSIEVHGFKSFANKLTFEFHDGITAIVGPNGSGKSNVGDAVRWVLGEQSAKQLRGAKMEDIIFSGTEARKPLGFAYVAITLDNSDHKLPIDYKEVTVARRVFRSGESEYLINGTNCRLRDVQELFLDTGIGKEGYSIIGQGQIEKILSGKPEERRELFDEAAGIVKFKKRKAAAEKNLEAEKQNLFRINDILTEIEHQIGPLERQSDVAKEYLKYRDELKVLDVNMFLMQYDHIHVSKVQLEEKYRIAVGDLNKAKDNLELAKSEYEKLEKQLEQFNQKIDDEKTKLSELKVRKEQLEGTINVLKEQIVTAKQSDSHYKERKTAIDGDIAAKQKELDEILLKKSGFDEKVVKLSSKKQEVEVRIKQAAQEIVSYNKQIDDLNSQIFEFLSENSNIKTKMQRYATILEQNNIKKVSMNQKLLKLKSDEATYDEEIQQEEEILNAITAKIHAKLDVNQDLTKEINEIQEDINQKKELHEATVQEYHKEKSRLDYLKNITERYEGYGNSIRKVMEQKATMPGIHGVVADIIKVNKEYEVAVETALGGSIQNVVTDNESTAKSLIEYLKKNRFGRATFLPLTSITNKNSFYNEKALSEPGVIGLASSLVETQSEYQVLIEYLLGRIVVVDHIDHAIALAKKYHYSLRIVTVEGELLSPGGSMSGGSYKNNSNLLGRRREIEEIGTQIESLQNTLQKLVQAAEELRQKKNELKDSIAENKKDMQELYLNQNTSKMQLSQAKLNKQKITDSFIEMRKESIEIDAQLKELKGNIETLQIELEANVAKSKGNEDEIARIQNLLEQKRMEEHTISEEMATIRVEESSLEQNHQYIQENIRRVKQDIKKLQEEKTQIDTNLLRAGEQVREKESAIVTVQNDIIECGTNIENLLQTIELEQKEKENVSNTHKSFFAKREELQNSMSQLDKETYRIQNQLEKLKEQLDVQINYMWEEYEITYSHARELRTEEERSFGEIKKAISDIRQCIKQLGDVNVNAIEDYKNLHERYELLRTQRDDLVKAEEVLQGIIEELDFEMRKQFEEKFGEIKEEFDRVFKELFGGGKGTLELVEDEDILEAGIRIIAQPPGKKLQNMMQLSGGEKSLTAISLLFAIQNLKPSPFCLLDEIEAALDDSNVKRYAKYLQKLTDHTQFIVITHRRGTMSAADRLYGITMQEKGISTLVSVDLIENQLDK